MRKYAASQTNIVQSEAILFEKKNIKFAAFLLMFFITTLVYPGIVSASPSYPIILVHGINSSDQMWYDSGLVGHLQSFGWSYGGTFDSDLWTPVTLGDVQVINREVADQSGDIWLVNFDYNNMYSKHSAIHKQGKALSIVIERVCSFTGKDKVILVGHSMGGLAIASYVVGDPDGNGNPDFFNNNVAKVITLGTPFGGSVVTTILSVFGFIPGFDSSDAFRDLAKSTENAKNVFLFGGFENEVGSQYNSDVSCNGIANDSYRIPGINEASWPSEISYFWLVGDWVDIVGIDTDGVVISDDQYLNFGEIKVIHAAHNSLGICREAACFDAIIEALDESDTASISWSLTQQITDGFITHQGDWGTDQDFDYYKFTLNGPHSVSVTLSNSPVAVTLSILDSDGASVLSTTSGQANDNVIVSYDFENLYLYPSTFFIRVEGSAQASDPGFGLLDTACESNQLNCRQSYYLDFQKTVIFTGTLSSPDVQPLSGDTNTNFQFSVTFTDPDNDPPDAGSVKLILDNTEYVMTTTDTDYTDGSVFVYPAAGGIQLSEGSHPYYFEAKQNAQDVQGSPTGTQTLNIGQPSAGQVTIGLSPNPVEVFQSTTVTATVKDSYNNPLQGVTVNFSQNGFPGVMSPTSDTTNAIGLATSTFTPNASGSALISAQVSGGASGSSYLTVNPGTITFELSFSPAPAGHPSYHFQAKLLNNSSPWQGENVTLTLSPGSIAYFNRTATATFSTTTNSGGYAQDGGSNVVDVTTTNYGVLTISAKHDGTGVISTITTNISDGSGTTFEAFKDLGYSGIDVDWSGNGSLVAIKDSGSYTYLVENILTTPVLWRSVYTDCATASGVVFSPTSSQMLVAGKGNNYETAVITLNYPSGSPSIVANDNDHGRVEDRACDWGGSRIITGRTNDPELEVYDTSLISVCGIDMADDVTAVAFDQTNPSRFVFGDWDGIIKAANTSCSVLWPAPVALGGGAQVTSAAWHGNNVIIGDNTGMIHLYNASGGSGSPSQWSHGSGWVTSTEFSPDGQWLATCGGGGIKIWSTGSWSVAYTGPSATVVAWDPTSTYLVDNAGKLYAPFNQTPPTIIISSPSDGYSTYDSTVDVSGTTTGPLGISSATITVNGGAPETLTLGPSGDFIHPVSLSLGANTIRIDASGGGKSSYSEITVTRLTDVDGPVISSVIVLPSTEEIGTIFNISASVIDAFSSVNAASVTCYIQLPDEINFATLQMYDDGTNGDATPSDSVYTCEWDSSGAMEDSYLIDITASDVPGNPSEAENVQTLIVYDLPSFGTPTVAPPSPTDTNEVTITITITDPAGISSKTLWYQHLKNPGWIPVAMTGSGPSYSSTIPMMDEGTVQYKAEATDGLGHTAESSIYQYNITDASAPVAWDWSRSPSDITGDTTGPVAVSLRVIDVGGSGLAGNPQMDYRISDGTFDGWEPMTAAGGITWTFEIPDLGWGASAKKFLEYKVTAVDKLGNELITPVQTELIDDIPAYLVITGSPTQTAGSAQTIAITAYYDSGNVASSYNGAKSLTFSGASSIDSYSPTVGGFKFGDGTAINFTGGEATAPMILYKVENASIYTTDGIINSTGHNLGVTVNPAELHHYSVDTPESGTIGVPFSTTITAKDAYVNEANWSGTVALSTTNGGDISPSAVSLSNGTWSGGVTLTIVGSERTVIVTRSGGTETGQDTIDLTGTVATPTFLPVGDTYTSPADVTISCATSGATIHYTTNGADPTESDPIYTVPIHISSTTTLKAKAWKPDWNTSEVAADTYVIRLPMDIYVDDDAPNDPGPSDPIVSDPLEDGTTDHPFDEFQEAVDVALDDDTVIVAEGTYYENLNLNDKDIILTSTDPSNQNVMASTIVNGDGNDSVIHITNSDVTIDGFTITNGFAAAGGGIYCENSNLTISDCIFSGNLASVAGGGMFMFGEGNSAILTNCTFIGNSGEYGGAIEMSSQIGENNATLVNCLFRDNSAILFGGVMDVWNLLGSMDIELINCTLTGNSAPNGNALSFDSDLQAYPSNLQVSNCILWNGNDEIWNGDGSTITINYSDIQSGWGGSGENNINVDPSFVDADNDNFHLLAGSQCIDAGNNSALPPDTADLDRDGNMSEPIPWDLEGHPRRIGDDVDMGVYEFQGLIIGDFCGANFTDPDGYVDVWDLMQFADHWHTQPDDPNWDGKYDLTGPNFEDLDGYIDVWDLMVFADNWHRGQKP